MFHSRSICNVILKSILNYLTARLNIERIYLWIYIIYDIELLSALFIKDKLHLFLVLYISCINYRNLKTHGANKLRVVKRCISFTEVNTASYQNEIRINFLYLCYIRSSQTTRRYVVDDSTCTESSFLCCLRCHIINEAVNCHL